MTLHTTASTCCYCGVGCGVLIEHDGQRIHNVQGDPQHPANLGRLCSKGANLHRSGDPAARALYPELRLGKSLLKRGRLAGLDLQGGNLQNHQAAFLAVGAICATHSRGASGNHPAVGGRPEEKVSVTPGAGVHATIAGA